MPPSFREGLPVAVMEAMASGLPIFCSKIRGCVDLVEPEKNGFFFEMRDSDACAEKMRVLITAFDTLASENRRKVSVYALNSITRQYKNVYMI